jgi:FMN phosphatase YigB (HAD superfamily)
MVFKNATLKALLLGLACTLSPSISAAQQPEQKKPYFFWDLHNVVFKSNRDLRNIASIWWNFDRKQELVFNLSRALCTELLTMYRNSKNTQDLKSDATGEAYMAIAERHGNLAFAAFILKIANAQKVIPGTADIILQLHKKGIKQYIGSNIGTSVLQDLKQSAEWQKYFSDQTIFDFDGSVTVDYRSADPIQKPDSRFYQAFLNKNNLDAQDGYFVDDKKVNVDGANEVGLNGVIFETPDQLKAELRNRGFELE